MFRHYLSKFWLPGEAQKIDRFMDYFSRQFCKNNPNDFPMADTAYLFWLYFIIFIWLVIISFINFERYVLAFSLIMLNTDQHNPAIKKENKMTLPQFLKNISSIPGIDQVPVEYLNARDFNFFCLILFEDIYIFGEFIFSNCARWDTHRNRRISF